MWACGRGHRETALVLYRWNHTALHIHNSLQQTALSYARAQGQMALAKEIEKLETFREEANMTLLSNTSNNLDRYYLKLEQILLIVLAAKILTQISLLYLFQVE